ncbi:MAG: YCF48-related protein [Burkholderiaceae bacterium]
MQQLTMKTLVCQTALLGATLCTTAATLAQEVRVAPARIDSNASRAMMLDIAKTGNHTVAVGEHGYVLLSNNDGRKPRQAKKVPVDFTLTAVSFVDQSNGWAVGHGSSVIHTTDGGDTWSLQHIDTMVDQPLFTVYFRDAQVGWAAGLWSLLLSTHDGGKTWTQVTLPLPPERKRADLNLLNIFPGSNNALYIAAEQGAVLRSNDDGASWQYMKTGSNASLWAGVTTPAHTLLVGGLGGKMFRSTDSGETWQPVSSQGDGSITHIVSNGKSLWATSLDGRLIRSKDDGQTWSVAYTDRAPLTAVTVRGDDSYVLYSKQGLVATPE